MSTDSIAKQKSMAFAIRIVHLYRYLGEEHHEYIMSKQLLRSGTSIGANIAEAIYGSSRKDFTAKLQIAEKRLWKPFIGWNFSANVPIFPTSFTSPYAAIAVNFWPFFPHPSVPVQSKIILYLISNILYLQKVLFYEIISRWWRRQGARHH